MTLLYELDHFEHPPLTRLVWKTESVAGPIFSEELFVQLAPHYERRLTATEFAFLVAPFLAPGNSQEALDQAITRKAQRILEEYA